LYNYKRLVGEVLGAAVAVVWIMFVFLVVVMIGSVLLLLAVAISLTLILGVLSDGFLKLSKKDEENKEDLYNYKTLVAELLGAGVPVVWICWALLVPGNLLFLSIAISLTILLGVLSGGFLKLSKNDQEGAKTKES